MNDQRHTHTHPNPKSSTKWITLGWTCLAMTGVYYSMDIPAALHQPLKDYMSSASFSPLKFNLLYSVYSIPNILLPFAGGYLVDRFGGPLSAVLFASLVCLGQALFSWGLYRKSWPLLFLARFVYGLGGECIGVATSAINSVFFHGSDLALAFGVNVAVSRLGSVLNNIASPLVAHRYGVVQAGILGTCMNLATLVSCLVIYKMHRVLYNTRNRHEDDDGGHDDDDDGHDGMTQPLLSAEENENDDAVEEEEGHDPTTIPDIPTDTAVPTSDNNNTMEIIHPAQDRTCTTTTTNTTNTTLSLRQQMQKFPLMFWLLSASCVVVYGCVLPFNNIASGILLERNYFTNPPTECVLKYPNQCSMGTLAPIDGNDISFDTATGLECILPSTTMPVLPMSIYVNRSDSIPDDEEGGSGDGQGLSWDHEIYNYPSLTLEDVDCNDSFWSTSCTANFCKAQESATERSTKVMSIPYILSATLSPFFGFLIDRIGNRAILASMASIILVMVHLSLSKTHLSFVENGGLQIQMQTASSPVLPLIGQGLAYVCYAAAIWPSIPLVVPKESLGTAFGAITAIQNLGLTIFPLIIAKIYDWSDESYIPNVEYFFVVCAFCGTLIGVWVNILDRRQNHVLNKVYVNMESL